MILMQDEQVEAIKRKSVRGVVSFFLRTIIIQGIGLVSALVLSAFFAPEDFGIFGLITQIIALLIFFSDIGLAAALIQQKAEPTNDDYTTAFSVQFLLAWLIFFSAVGLVQVDGIQQKIGMAGIYVFLALGISFPLASLKTIPSIILERKLDFNKLVIPQIFEQIVFHSLLIMLAWKGYGISAYTYAVVSRSLIGVVVMQFLQPWRPRLGIKYASLKNLLGFGFKFQLNDLLARIKDQLYFLVLGAYFPIRDFGYLQWAKNWSMYPYNLTVQNVMSITFPTFSRLQDRPELLGRAIEKSVYFITLFIFPILVLMSLFVHPLTQLVTEYQKWQPALISFVLFTASIAWSAISTPLLNSLNAIGKINQTLKLMVFWTLLTWVLTPLLVWKFDFNGVALAALLISFTSIFSVILIKRSINLRLWSQVWPQLLASACMIFFAWTGWDWWQLSWQYFSLGIIGSCLVYGAIILLVAYQKCVKEFASLRKSI